VKIESSVFTHFYHFLWLQQRDYLILYFVETGLTTYCSGHVFILPLIHGKYKASTSHSFFHHSTGAPLNKRHRRTRSKNVHYCWSITYLHYHCFDNTNLEQSCHGLFQQSTLRIEVYHFQSLPSVSWIRSWIRCKQRER